MKKPAAVVFTASSLLGLVGCGAPQLSTSETCVELRVITASFSSDSSDEDRKAALDDMDKLAGRASDSLKGVISDVALANRERLKPAKDQNAAKISEAQDRIDAKSDMVKDVCDL